MFFYTNYNALFFLLKAVEIARPDYEPSDMDILYADGITSSNGISCMEFSFPKPVHFSVLGPVDQTEPLERSVASFVLKH